MAGEARTSPDSFIKAESWWSGCCCEGILSTVMQTDIGTDSNLAFSSVVAVVCSCMLTEVTPHVTMQQPPLWSVCSYCGYSVLRLARQP